MSQPSKFPIKLKIDSKVPAYRSDLYNAMKNEKCILDNFYV